MSDVSKFDREFLRTAMSLASKAEVDHFLYISDTPIPSADLRGRRCRRKLIYAVTSEALAVELTAKKNRALIIPAYDYSRTERVKIALGLAQQPELLLLDEPTQHLDIGRQLEMVALIRSLSRRGIAIIASMHDLTLIEGTFSSVWLLTPREAMRRGAPQTML